jgi:hypothetical protein
VKITNSQLKQIIKEEYAGQAEDEGHADSYNYGERTPLSLKVKTRVMLRKKVSN